MSLRLRFPVEIPEETVRVAKKIYGSGNLYMQIRDELADWVSDEQFADLYPRQGRPAMSPGRLALVLIFQYVADYSDRQAAEAVRDQISWKYALSLELDDVGFDYSVLSDFRQRLVAAGAHERLFEAILEHLMAQGLLKGKGRQRTDATYVLARVRQLNRLELVGETLRMVLNRLAQLNPDWLQAQAPAEWWDRYSQRFNDWHLPKTDPKRQALAGQIGQDGSYLLSLLDTLPADHPLRHLPEIAILQQIWQHQFQPDGSGGIQLRDAKQLPAGADMIASPFDAEARFSQDHRHRQGLGYKTHLTETCGEHAPHLLTHVQTCVATDADNQSLPLIQAALSTRGLKPDEHYLDSGYASVDHLLTSTQAGIDLLSPMRPDSSWQARQEPPMGVAQFWIDWEQQVVTCPHGQQSVRWSEAHQGRTPPVIQVRFDPADCGGCPLRLKCTTSTARSLKLRPRLWQEALQQARERQQTADFQAQYRRRAGIEGSISQAIRRCDLRHSPYIGLSKTSLHCLLVAAALNMLRAINWLHEVPLATTRKSRLSLWAA